MTFLAAMEVSTASNNGVTFADQKIKYLTYSHFVKYMNLMLLPLRLLSDKSQEFFRDISCSRCLYLPNGVIILSVDDWKFEICKSHETLFITNILRLVLIQ